MPSFSSESGNTSSSPRRWCLPPTLDRDPAFLLDGEEILIETTGTLGLVLWQSCRDVALWATTNARDRRQLFAPEAHTRRLALVKAAAPAAADRLAETALLQLATLLARPGAAEAGAISAACKNLSDWARDTRRHETALAFAQAAFAAAPTDAAAAVTTGALAFVLKKYARAESWLRRAVAVARRTEDWRPYTQALVHLGEVLIATGQRERATSSLNRALRSSRRHSHHDLRAPALFNLFVIARDAGDLRTAQGLGLSAMKAARKGSQMYYQIATALIEMMLGGEEPAYALPLARRLPNARELREHQRPHAYALLAHATAAAGEDAEFKQAWSAFWRLCRGAATPVSVETAMHVVRAAAVAGKPPLVAQASRLLAERVAAVGVIDLPPDIEAALRSQPR